MSYTQRKRLRKFTSIDVNLMNLSLRKNSQIFDSQVRKKNRSPRKVSSCAGMTVFVAETSVIYRTKQEEFLYTLVQTE